MNLTGPTLPQEPVDAIVIGSGAAGSAMAAYLAEGGKRVLILEAGPPRETSQMVSSALFARRLKWSGTPVIEEGKNPISHVFNAGYGVGGSAAHHYAVWPRMHVEDFEMFARFKRGKDWPISYAELSPLLRPCSARGGRFWAMQNRRFGALRVSRIRCRP